VVATPILGYEVGGYGRRPGKGSHSFLGLTLPASSGRPTTSDLTRAATNPVGGRYGSRRVVMFAPRCGPGMLKVHTARPLWGRVYSNRLCTPATITALGETA
jgi:hypothetical protein